MNLFNLNLSSYLFKFCLQSLSISLGNLLLNGLWSTVNEILSFLQSKTGEFLHSLYNLKLLSAG